MDKEKYVDESWKQQATHEKDQLATGPEQTEGGEKQQEQTVATETTASGETEGTDEQLSDIEVNFLNYITSLGFQAMIFMAEIPNPISNETEKNLPQAKFLIDTLTMLKDKTKGNLSDQEKGLLENSIYELQMKYIQHVKNEADQSQEQSS